ncbi:hypothetical protein PMIN03_006386 [Paraphaeosphaeria minitans]
MVLSARLRDPGGPRRVVFLCVHDPLARRCHNLPPDPQTQRLPFGRAWAKKQTRRPWTEHAWLPPPPHHHCWTGNQPPASHTAAAPAEHLHAPTHPPRKRHSPPDATGSASRSSLGGAQEPPNNVL